MRPVGPSWNQNAVGSLYPVTHTKAADDHYRRVPYFRDLNVPFESSLTRREGASPGTAETWKEAFILKRLTLGKCSSTSEYLASLEGTRDDDMWIPGEHIIYILMKRVSGNTTFHLYDKMGEAEKAIFVLVSRMRCSKSFQISTAAQTASVKWLDTVSSYAMSAVKTLFGTGKDRHGMNLFPRMISTPSNVLSHIIDLENFWKTERDLIVLWEKRRDIFAYWDLISRDPDVSGLV